LFRQTAKPTSEFKLVIDHVILARSLTMTDHQGDPDILENADRYHS